MSDPSAFYESLIFAGSGTLGEVLVSGIRDRFEVPGRKNFVGSMNLWMVPIYVAAPSLIHQLQPAIEYVEEGEDEPKFRAVKIDGVEHINDINDEIIATLPDSFDNAL